MLVLHAGRLKCRILTKSSGKAACTHTHTHTRMTLIKMWSKTSESTVRQLSQFWVTGSSDTVPQAFLGTLVKG